MAVRVIVRFQFEGVHYWPGAPEDAAILRHPHRHVFHVEAAMPVTHDDRDVEFIELKRVMQLYCVGMFTGPHPLSCEMIARRLVDRFALDKCAVFEDGENGAEVTR